VVVAVQRQINLQQTTQRSKDEPMRQTGGAQYLNL
jgi:hypothetical protein